MNIESPVYAWCEDVQGYAWTCPACHALYIEHSKVCRCGQALEGNARSMKEFLERHGLEVEE